MKKLMHLMMLSCKRASFLIELSSHKPLSFVERWQLRWHLRMCVNCTAYKKQSLYIENILKQNQINFSNLKTFKLEDRSKERIKKALDHEISKF